jgi:3-hydroxyisobutyrate dehydrogenase-like beta-hydroxyacid dehydrogenase
VAERAIGLLHPGEMGASVGRALVVGGARVLWCGAGRSGATVQRAAAAGLEDAGDLATLVRRVTSIVSVCPPAAAAAVAEAVVASGFRGTYVDANAVAPATAAAIAARVETSGCRFVDGGIIGPPAQRSGTTRLYLSGSGAAGVAALFDGTELEARVVAGGAGAASALKMAYAGWTKGSAALLLAARALAQDAGVEESLLAEWGLSQPHLERLSEGTARNVSPKAWRFAGEMDEIAATFGAAGLPDGFHRAAAEVYRRLARFRDGPPAGATAAANALLEGAPPADPEPAHSEPARRTSSTKKPTASR